MKFRQQFFLAFFLLFGSISALGRVPNKSLTISF